MVGSQWELVMIDGGEDVYKGRAEPMLVLLSDSYSEDNRILGR